MATGIIENKSLAARQDLTNIQATGTTNTTGAAIPAGAYFYLNGILCQAKVQIDQNATFTVSTNYEQVMGGGFNKLKSAINNLLQVVYGSQTSVAVPNDTTTVIDSISLPSGTYLIMGSTSISVSSNTNMSLAIVGSGGVGSLVASRGTADAGGGLLVCAVVTIEDSTTFTLRLRHSAGDNVSTVGNKFSAIQLK